MADSPARRHMQRVLAAKAAACNDGNQLMPGTGVYEQTMLQLASDRGRLKQIQSGEGKAQLKAQLLPAYDAYIEGVLDAGQGAADEVVTTVMLWNIDAGRYAEGLRVAEYVLRHNLAMPDRFERTTGCVVAEEVAEVALNALRAGTDFDVAVLDQAMAITEGQDMPDQVRAKLLLARSRWILKAIAKASDEPQDGQPFDPAPQLTVAIESLRRAIQLHDGCGGKKDLESAERLLKKHTASQPTG